MAIELADVPIQVVSPRGAVAHRAAPVSSATLVAAALAVAATLYLGFAVSGRQAALFLVGVAAGVVLYHAAFGFTSSWRVSSPIGRGAGLRAQMLMLAVTCASSFRCSAGRIVRPDAARLGLAGRRLRSSPARSSSASACNSAAAAPRARCTRSAAAIRGCWSRWPRSSPARSSARRTCRGGARRRPRSRCR